MSLNMQFHLLSAIQIHPLTFFLWVTQREAQMKQCLLVKVTQLLLSIHELICWPTSQLS